MALIVRRNGNLFPSLMTDLLDTERFFDTDLVLPSNTKSFIPAANITERDKDFLIELAAPGMAKKDFKVEIENNMLSISSEKEEKHEEKKDGVSRKEFSYNSFSRSFRLPENSKADKIEAEYENGILKVAIPKKEITVSKAKKEITVS